MPVLQNNISKSLIKPMTRNRFYRYKRINMWTEWRSNRMGCHGKVLKSTSKSRKRFNQFRNRLCLDHRLFLSNQRTHFSCLLMMSHLYRQKMMYSLRFLLACQNPSSHNSWKNTWDRSTTKWGTPLSIRKQQSSKCRKATKHTTSNLKIHLAKSKASPSSTWITPANKNSELISGIFLWRTEQISLRCYNKQLILDGTRCLQIA